MDLLESNPEKFSSQKSKLYGMIQRKHSKYQRINTYQLWELFEYLNYEIPGDDELEKKLKLYMEIYDEKRINFHISEYLKPEIKTEGFYKCKKCNTFETIVKEVGTHRADEGSKEIVYCNRCKITFAPKR